MRHVVKLVVAALLFSGTVALAETGGRSDTTDQTPCGKPGQPPCKENGEATGDQQKQAPNAQQGQTPAGQQGQTGSQQDQTPRAKKAKSPAGEPQQSQTPSAQEAPPPAGKRGKKDQTTVQQGQTPTVQQGSTPAVQKDRAPFGQREQKDQSPAGQERQTGQQNQPRLSARWSRGDRLPDEYREDQFAVSDWQRNNLPPPPRGYRWMCYQRGDCFLVANNTGIIRQTYWRNDRETYWRKRYSRTYRYSDDLYYRECRNHPDPAGILIGGLIGGLIGNAAGDDDRAGATFLGIIIGAGLGAAMTSDLDCDDRSYAYRAYYDGLNYGRPGVRSWRNPHNNHRGEFRVRSYYYDTDGFRCANYSHVVYLDRTRRANGRACRQPDGAWAFLN